MYISCNGAYLYNYNNNQGEIKTQTYRALLKLSCLTLTTAPQSKAYIHIMASYQSVSYQLIVLDQSVSYLLIDLDQSVSCLLIGLDQSHSYLLDWLRPKCFTSTDWLRQKCFISTDWLRLECFISTDWLRPECFISTDWLRPKCFISTDWLRPKCFIFTDWLRPDSFSLVRHDTFNRRVKSQRVRLCLILYAAMVLVLGNDFLFSIPNHVYFLQTYVTTQLTATFTFVCGLQHLTLISFPFLMIDKVFLIWVDNFWLDDNYDFQNQNAWYTVDLLLVNM